MYWSVKAILSYRVTWSVDGRVVREYLIEWEDPLLALSWHNATDVRNNANPLVVIGFHRESISRYPDDGLLRQMLVSRPSVVQIYDDDEDEPDGISLGSQDTEEDEEEEDEDGDSHDDEFIDDT